MYARIKLKKSVGCNEFPKNITQTYFVCLKITSSEP